MHHQPTTELSLPLHLPLSLLFSFSLLHSHTKLYTHYNYTTCDSFTVHATPPHLRLGRHIDEQTAYRTMHTHAHLVPSPPLPSPPLPLSLSLSLFSCKHAQLLLLSSRLSRASLTTSLSCVSLTARVRLSASVRPAKTSLKSRAATPIFRAISSFTCPTFQVGWTDTTTEPPWKFLTFTSNAPGTR